MSSMITTTAWVPRGSAAPFPKKYDFDEQEFERIAELAQLQLDDAQQDWEDVQEEENENGEKTEESSAKKDKSSKKEQEKSTEKSEKIDIDDDDLKEYDLEHYDDDEEEDTGAGAGATASGVEKVSIFGNVKSLAYYESNKEDPYITLNDADAEDEEDDRQDLQVLATDNLLLAAKVEDEMAHLEVYVYEDEADNLYVHHDIMLPAIPLCVEWLDLPVGKTDVAPDAAANFVAVGTMDPDIEIWDLDTVDCMYPNAILGQGAKKGGEDGIGEKKKKKKKNKKSKKANDEYHVDAVLSLAANRKHRNLLASASADKTIKLWDLNTASCAKSYAYHTDKVCSVAWHAVESTVLLSGSYDRTVVVSDMRVGEAAVAAQGRLRWGVESDVENVRWDPHDANFFFVSTENGMVHYHDIRNAPADLAATKAVWTLQAHDESVSSFDVNPSIPGFMATGSGDRTVKLWNIQPSGGPSLVVSRSLDVGKVFSTNFAPDPEVAFRLSVAGSKGNLTVWDTSTNAAVRQAFASRLPARPDGEGEIEERLVGVEDNDDDEESSDDDDDDAENQGGAAVDEDEDMGDA